MTAAKRYRVLRGISIEKKPKARFEPDEIVPASKLRDVKYLLERNAIEPVDDGGS